MVLAIEPMITAGTCEIQAGRDGWSIYTTDGSLRPTSSTPSRSPPTARGVLTRPAPGTVVDEPSPAAPRRSTRRGALYEAPRPRAAVRSTRPRTRDHRVVTDARPFHRAAPLPAAADGSLPTALPTGVALHGRRRRRERPPGALYRSSPRRVAIAPSPPPCRSRRARSPAGSAARPRGQAVASPRTTTLSALPGLAGALARPGAAVRGRPGSTAARRRRCSPACRSAWASTRSSRSSCCGAGSDAISTRRARRPRPRLAVDAAKRRRSRPPRGTPDLAPRAVAGTRSGRERAAPHDRIDAAELRGVAPGESVDVADTSPRALMSFRFVTTTGLRRTAAGTGSGRRFAQPGRQIIGRKSVNPVRVNRPAIPRPARGR